MNRSNLIRRFLTSVTSLFVMGTPISGKAAPLIAMARYPARAINTFILIDGASIAAAKRRSAVSLNQDSSAWGVDYRAALERAARENKRVLLNFTGSDWCGWCHRLEADVFATPEFKKYAAENFVLVTVDFPRKTPLPADLTAQNASLKRRHGVRGFPTVIVVDPDGVKLAEVRGYIQGGPKAFLAALESKGR